jgi:cell division protein FtsB
MNIYVNSTAVILSKENASLKEKIKDLQAENESVKAEIQTLSEENRKYRSRLITIKKIVGEIYEDNTEVND